MPAGKGGGSTVQGTGHSYFGDRGARWLEDVAQAWVWPELEPEPRCVGLITSPDSGTSFQGAWKPLKGVKQWRG